MPDDDATLREFLAWPRAAQAAAIDEIEKAALRLMYRTLPRAQLEALHVALTLDRAVMGESSRAFCDRRLAVLEELLA